MVNYVFCHRRLCMFGTLLFLVLLLAGGCTSPSANTQTPITGSPSGQFPGSPCLTSREAMNSVGKTACVEFLVGNPSQFKGEVYLNEIADYTKGFQAVILPDSAGNFDNPVLQYRR